ncbi:MAG: AAA family ATPase [Deltaproteobacteria bacterium]|nr:AAA family ATPase [Deltaproteobacteria bacterium]
MDIFDEDDELRPTNMPNPKDLEKELSEYLSKKYGNQVKVISPKIVPRVAMSNMGQGQEKKTSAFDKINFKMKPEELKAYLKKYIIKQDDALDVLATKICTHFNKIRFLKKLKADDGPGGVGAIKNNIILVGPTGVGKTYAIKLIANKIGVPFVKGDATKYSETGYVGGDVEDLIRDLVTEANDDLDLAQYGIVYLDEIDKIASSRNLIGHDVSRLGVQRALLKPMEETDINLRVAHDPISQLQAIEQYRKTGKREKRVLNTKNILFIVSGAFNGLEQIVQKRINQQHIGFGAEISSKDGAYRFLTHVRAEDLIEFGFESEFIGRLPVTAVFQLLGVNDLYDILKNSNSPIMMGKKRDFKSYGIDIKFEDEALRKVAEIAALEKTGARALVSALERILIKFEKTLPSTDIKAFVVTPELVAHPDRELERLLTREQDLSARYECQSELERVDLLACLMNKEEEFLENYGLHLNPARAGMIIDHFVGIGIDMSQAFERLFNYYNQIKDYELHFLERTSLRITFSLEAQDELVRMAMEKLAEPIDIIADMPIDLEYALKMLSDKTGIKSFGISKMALTDPENFLEETYNNYYLSR